MRVVLALPPSIHNLEIYKVTGMRAPPLGLAYIASVLEKAGHKVKIVDSPTRRLEYDQWLNEVKSFNPDIVGISMITPMAPKGYMAAKMLKKEMPDVPLVSGGTHVTSMYEEALDAGYDFVVRGEGEYTMLELTNTLESKGYDYESLTSIKGLAFRHEGKTILTPERPFIANLDELPWPDRDLLDMDKYTLFNKPVNIAHVMASRGCPYGCIYCITSYYWGRRFRHRSPKNVVDEIEYIKNKYKVNTIVFTDDEFTSNWYWLKDFINELKSRNVDINFTCGTRVDHVNKDIMKMLYDNGCTALYFGVESGSQETLNKIGKRITIRQAKRVFQWKKELKGFATGAFILGFPWETIDDMKNTVKLALELEPDYAQFTALTPYPGTPLWYFAKEHNLIVDNNWEHYTTVRPVIRGFNFTSEQLGRMVVYAYRKFYLRWKFITQEFKAHRLGDLFSVITREFVSVFGDAIGHVFEPLRWNGGDRE
ncbi:MAG: B12-binding domain-containing radical SAM protein [Caldisphaeraceae archaeon]|nr:B12-binding domain-containing radical SAM protein [Caldisphaeraceae archaeon]